MSSTHRGRSISWVMDAAGRWHAQQLAVAATAAADDEPASAPPGGGGTAAAAAVGKAAMRRPWAVSAAYASFKQAYTVVTRARSESWTPAAAAAAAALANPPPSPSSPPPANSPSLPPPPPPSSEPSSSSPRVLITSIAEETEGNVVPPSPPPRCELCATHGQTHAPEDCPFFCGPARSVADEQIAWRSTDFVPMERWINALLQQPPHDSSEHGEMTENDAWEAPFDAELKGAELSRWRDVLLLTLPYHSSPFDLLRRLLLLLRAPPPPSPYEANPIVFGDEGDTSMAAAARAAIEEHEHDQQHEHEQLRVEEVDELDELLLLGGPSHSPSPAPLLPGTSSSQDNEKISSVTVGQDESTNNKTRSADVVIRASPTIVTRQLHQQQQRNPQSKKYTTPLHRASLDPLQCPHSPPTPLSGNTSSAASSCNNSGSHPVAVSSSSSTTIANNNAVHASTTIAVSSSNNHSLVSPSSSVFYAGQLSLSPGSCASTVVASSQGSSVGSASASVSLDSRALVSSSSSSSSGSGNTAGTQMVGSSAVDSTSKEQSNGNNNGSIGAIVLPSWRRVSSAAAPATPSNRHVAFHRWHASKLHVLQLLQVWIKSFPQDFCCVPFQPSPPRSGLPGLRTHTLPGPSLPPFRPLEELLARELAAFPAREWLRVVEWDRLPKQSDATTGSTTGTGAGVLQLLGPNASGRRGGRRRHAVAMDAAMMASFRAVSEALQVELLQAKRVYFGGGVDISTTVVNSTAGAVATAAASTVATPAEHSGSSASAPPSSAPSPKFSVANRGWSVCQKSTAASPHPATPPSVVTSSASGNATPSPLLLSSAATPPSPSHSSSLRQFVLSSPPRASAQSVVSSSSSASSTTWSSAWGSAAVQHNLAMSDKAKRLMGASSATGGNGGNQSSNSSFSSAAGGPSHRRTGSGTAPSSLLQHHLQQQQQQQHRGTLVRGSVISSSSSSSSARSSIIPSSPSSGPLAYALLQSQQAKSAADFLAIPARNYASALTWLAIQRLAQIGACAREGPGAPMVLPSSSSVPRPSFHHATPLSSPSFPRLFLRMLPSLSRAQMSMSNTFSCFVATTVLQTPSVAIRKQLVQRWVEIAVACLNQPLQRESTYLPASATTSAATATVSSDAASGANSNGSTSHANGSSNGTTAGLGLPLCNPNFMHAFEIIYGLNHQSVYRLPAVQAGPDGRVPSQASRGSVFDVLTARKGSGGVSSDGSSASPLPTALPLLDKKSFLSREAFDQYTLLTKLTSPNLNYREYRKALQSVEALLPWPSPPSSMEVANATTTTNVPVTPSPTTDGPPRFHVPYLGILLKDLVGLEEAGRPLAGQACAARPASSLLLEEDEDQQDDASAATASAIALAAATSESTTEVNGSSSATTPQLRSAMPSQSGCSPSASVTQHRPPSPSLSSNNNGLSSTCSSESSPAPRSSLSKAGTGITFTTAAATASAAEDDDLLSAPPSGSLPWDDSFLLSSPRARRNATMTPVDHEAILLLGGGPNGGSGGLAGTGPSRRSGTGGGSLMMSQLGEEDETEEDVFRNPEAEDSEAAVEGAQEQSMSHKNSITQSSLAATSEDEEAGGDTVGSLSSIVAATKGILPAVPATAAAAAPSAGGATGLVGSGARRSASLLQMLTAEDNASSPSNGIGGRSTSNSSSSELGFAKEALGTAQTGLFKPVSLLSASLPGRGGGGASVTASSTGAPASVTPAPAASPPPPPPPACMLLNHNKLSKIHAIAHAALRCRLFFPQPPVDAEGCAIVPLPPPPPSAVGLSGATGAANGAELAASAAAMDPFTRALVGAALVPSMAQALRDASGPPVECARPAPISIQVVGDSFSDGGQQCLLPRSANSKDLNHNHPAGLAATLPSPSSSLQFDSRLQHWLVSSMLTVTLLEETQLMQRSYELFPRAVRKQVSK